MIEGYKIIRELGRGGMATVYLAKQVPLDRWVALKVLKGTNIPGKDYIKRFFREARITAQLTHPNIISIYESNYSQEGGVFYIVTEYIDGGDFFNFLNAPSTAARSGSGLREKISILTKVVHALDYAHQKGVVHRDVKPSNILLTKTREPKLCDFGIATALWGSESRFTRTNEVFGTMDYIAPEQKENSKSVDLRVDIFSIGVILYQLITGRKPQGAFPSPITIHPSIPEKLDAIVMKCLQPLPIDRYKNARNLAEELESVLTESPTEILRSPSRTATNTSITSHTTPSAHLSSSSPAPGSPSSLVSPVEKTEFLPQHVSSTPGDLTRIDTRQVEFSRMIEILKSGSISEKLVVKKRFLDSVDSMYEPRLIQLIKDSSTDGVLKETVIEAIGKIKSKNSCQSLIELLSDPYYNKFAADAIGEIGCSEAEEKLFKILLNRNEKSYIALLPLGKLHSVKSIELISEYLTDTHPWIRELALDALALIGGKKVIDYLENITNRDPDANIRAKSKKILWRLKT